MQGSYRHLDHTADLGIDAEAPDEASLFEVCGRAMFDILAGEDSRIEASEFVNLDVEESEPDLLLASWLRELLHLHESEGWLFALWEVSTGRAPGGRLSVSARLGGERYDPRRHRLETEIKAVTYHQLSVRRNSRGVWKARVIFDI